MVKPLALLKLQEQYLSAALKITDICKNILEQDGIGYVPQVPSLQQHQTGARLEAKFWLEDIWTLINETAHDIFKFAKEFKTCYEKCLEIIKTGGDVKSQIVKLLTPLQDSLTSMESSINTIVRLVKKFHTDFEQLNTQFERDLRQADHAISDDNEQLRELKGQKIYYLGRKAHWERMSYIPFYGIYAAIEYGKACDKLRQINREIGDINRDVWVLNEVESSIRSLKSNTSVITPASDKVSDAWKSLVADIDQVIEDIKDASQEEVIHKIKIDLGVAYLDWKEVLLHAHGIFDDFD